MKKHEIHQMVTTAIEIRRMLKYEYKPNQSIGQNPEAFKRIVIRYFQGLPADLMSLAVESMETFKPEYPPRWGSNSIYESFNPYNILEAYKSDLYLSEEDYKSISDYIDFMKG